AGRGRPPQRRRSQRAPCAARRRPRACGPPPRCPPPGQPDRRRGARPVLTCLEWIRFPNPETAFKESAPLFPLRKGGVFCVCGQAAACNFCTYDAGQCSFVLNVSKSTFLVTFSVKCIQNFCRKVVILYYCTSFR